MTENVTSFLLYISEVIVELITNEETGSSFENFAAVFIESQFG